MDLNSIKALTLAAALISPTLVSTPAEATELIELDGVSPTDSREKPSVRFAYEHLPPATSDRLSSH
jgi:hypothetical protein